MEERNMKQTKMLVVLLLVIFAPTSLRAQSASAARDDRQADRDLIRAHIESIFQAFIDWDIDKIYATHSQDWHGFLEGTTVPIQGINDYMKANGIDWPK